jgi:hypothetical protein
MAIIKNISEIIDLIPTYNDLLRCNCASALEVYTENKPLYAFVFDNASLNYRRRYKANFMLAALEDIYILFLIEEGECVSRYSDYIVLKRNKERALYRTDWKWNIDSIGLSITSDNVSRNIIYFGTNENDAVKVRIGIVDGLRKTEGTTSCITTGSDRLLIHNKILTAIRSGFPKFVPNCFIENETKKCLPYLMNKREMFRELTNACLNKERLVTTETVFV